MEPLLGRAGTTAGRRPPPAEVAISSVRGDTREAVTGAEPRLMFIPYNYRYKSYNTLLNKRLTR